MSTVPGSRPMTHKRGDDPMRIEDDEPRGAENGAPRVFVWGDRTPEPGLIGKVLGRFRKTGRRPSRVDRGRADLPPAVFRPPVTRRAPPGVETSASAASRDAAPVLDLPAAPGWEPPDLTTEVDEAADAETTSSPAAPGSTEPPADHGHGPGPIYRATLQLLPGRLRPLDPDIVREEIRFVRPSGRDAVVTLGWGEGEPPDHITVNHPSVHDQHARMSFIDRTWRIESLVPEHPVYVNGEPLPVGSEPRELQSDDEVRLGDASFSFMMP